MTDGIVFDAAPELRQPPSERRAPCLRNGSTCGETARSTFRSGAVRRASFLPTRRSEQEPTKCTPRRSRTCPPSSATQRWARPRTRRAEVIWTTAARYALLGEGNDWTVLGPGAGSFGRIEPTRALTPNVDKRDGRLRFSLCASGAKPRTMDLGRVVLLALVGPPPPGTECCHGDGDPTNNRIGNLRWDTSSANRLDSVRHGTHPRLYGERNPSSKISDDDAETLRNEYAAGATQQALGTKYGLSQSHVSRIVSGCYRRSQPR